MDFFQQRQLLIIGQLYLKDKLIYLEKKINTFISVKMTFNSLEYGALD